ncbi:MAG: hypothetical protein JWR04_961 [Rhodoglobus sp.]|nr:hypothetical protein [Rhodoglobus sp.]
MNDSTGVPPLPPAAWYASPRNPGRLEYWDGTRWTGRLSPDTPALVPPVMTLGTWTKVGLILSGLVLPAFLISSGIPGFFAAAGSIAFFTAAFVLVTGKRSWAMIPSRKLGVLVLVGAVVALGIGGSLAPKRVEPSALQFTSGSEEQSPSPTATRAPVVKTEDVVVTESVPFEATTVEDPDLAAGTTQVTTAGQAGTRTITYRVTTTDGRETKRTVVSDVISVPPVSQVTSNGTYVEPPPAAPVPFADAGSGCDGNYSGACVPIASDVDCAGGSGNGPAYVSGPVYIVGTDIYELDRDGDGIACDT